jgi:hypothetical protein
MQHCIVIIIFQNLECIFFIASFNKNLIVQKINLIYLQFQIFHNTLLLLKYGKEEK